MKHGDILVQVNMNLKVKRSKAHDQRNDRTKQNTYSDFTFKNYNQAQLF